MADHNLLQRLEGNGEVKISQKMACENISDSGFISPPTKTVTTFHENTTSDDFITPYFLRASSRCGSSPFPLTSFETPSLDSLGGTSKSSPSLPTFQRATSTPANAYVSNDQFQKRLEENSYSSDGSSSQDADSGIESLIGNDSTGNLFEASTKIGCFPVDSAKFSPIAQRSLGAVPKRRSPRQVSGGHKVDGIERLTRILKGTNSENGNSLNSDCSTAGHFIVPSLEKFEEKKDKQVLLLSRDPCREGRETVDVMRHLYEKDLVFILDTIFQYLAPSDLCSLAQVSQLWNLGLQCRKEHDNRRKEFVKLKKLDRENWGKLRITRSSPRRAMTDLANVNRLSPSSKRDRNPSCNALLSPSKIRHRLFVEEAAKLSPGERLVHCPLCTSPCRVTSATPPRARTTPLSPAPPPPSIATPPPTKSAPCLTSQAICSSVKCNFIFCPDCHCEDHPDRPCRVTRSGTKVPKSGTVTSKKSKARLRRL